MTFITAQETSVGILTMLTRPFVAFGKSLVRIAETSALAQAANELAEMSDSELAAKGLTREQAIEKLFANYPHL